MQFSRSGIMADVALVIAKVAIKNGLAREGIIVHDDEITHQAQHLVEATCLAVGRRYDHD